MIKLTLELKSTNCNGWPNLIIEFNNKKILEKIIEKKATVKVNLDHELKSNNQLIIGINNKSFGRKGIWDTKTKDNKIIEVKTLTITSKGMRMDTLMATARETTSWTTDMDIRCNPTQTWDDEGGPDNRKLEVAELIYDNVAINFSGSTLRGTVCFSKDGTYYSTAGALETDPFFYICRRSSTNTRCDVSDAGVPDEELVNVFAINWSRFGNITLEKWSKTKDDWVLQ